MKFTRRQIATTLSVIYLAVMTALAAYALHQSHHYAVPISSTLTSLTLALPLLAGLSLETSTALARSLSTSKKFRHRHASNIPAVLLPSTLTVLGLLMYTTVVATLAGTHISPVGGLSCALREKWQSLFRDKNGNQLRQIQDGLECCGFRTVRDMPFPFPAAGRGVGVDECTRLWPERLHRSCEAGWRGVERTSAGCILAVAIGTFFWMAIIVAIPAIHPTWARDSLRLSSSSASSKPRNAALLEAATGGNYDGANDAEDQHRRITDYNDDDEIDEEPYRDNPAETEQDRQDRLREIAALNNDSRLALQVESSREHHPSRLMREVGDRE
ncbi:hypothetical protein AAFC00_006436 [Neodothiora populina]|uniref:Tetraspanin Tsp3 n=1 Tax=Neodothiora populina TaxID=2781224 RepID=A0ABR3P5Y4_9PEZI